MYSCVSFPEGKTSFVQFGAPKIISWFITSATIWFMVVITTVIWRFKPTYNILWPHIADHPFRFWTSSSFAPRNHNRSEVVAGGDSARIHTNGGCYHQGRDIVWRFVFSESSLEYIGVWKIKLSDISLKSEIYPKWKNEDSCFLRKASKRVVV